LEGLEDLFIDNPGGHCAKPAYADFTSAFKPRVKVYLH